MRRRYHLNRWVRFALWLVAGGLVLLLVAVFWWVENEYQRGITFSAAQAPIPWTDVSQGGVNLPSLHFEQPDTITRTLDLVQAAGFRWVRVQFPWEDIEINGKGDFRDFRHDYNGDGTVNDADAISAWTKYDGIVAAAQQRDLELIVRLDRPPAWARTNLPQEPFRVAQRAQDPGATGPPDNYADYADYVAAVVGRYRGKLRFFQIWNEPNYGHEWNWADPDPAQFLELLKLGYTRAKAVNPEAVILFPSLTPADGLDWQAMSDLAFLERIYERGGGQYFDIFTAQQYGLGQPPDENRYVRLVYNAQGQPRRDTLLRRPLDSRTDVTRVILLREIMERYGDTNKAVWISEFGWNSSAQPTQFGPSVTEEQKGAYLVSLMARARREWPWMGVMNIWFLRAGAGFNPDDPTVQFQLVREDWTPLPAFRAVQAYLAAPPVLGPGSYAPDHPAVSRSSDGELTLRFWGTGVQIDGAQNSQILVDAQSAYTGTSQITIDNLTLGEHGLRIRGNPPTRITIRRANSLQLLWLLLPFGLLLLLIMVVYRGLLTLTKVA